MYIFDDYYFVKQVNCNIYVDHCMCMHSEEYIANGANVVNKGCVY